MPVYQYRCCGKEVEVLQGIEKDTPLCPQCGAKMEKLPTSPAIITIKGGDGTRTYSKGYKEGYAKDYQRDIPPFEPRDVGNNRRSNASFVNK